MNINNINFKLPNTGDFITISLFYENDKLIKLKGVVLSISNYNVRIRSLIGNVGVERVLNLLAPYVKNISINKKGKYIRRSKIYYIRNNSKLKNRLKNKKKSYSYLSNTQQVQSTFKNLSFNG